MLDVLAIGAANIDYFYLVEKIPKAGEEAAAEFSGFAFGGSAANFAVASARLNLKSGFSGCLGDDAEGKMLLEDFRKEKVNTEFVSLVKEATGRVVVLLDKKKDRTLIACPGSGDSLIPEMISEAKIKQAKLIHITNLSSENSIKALVKAKQIAVKLGVKVSVDPGSILAEKPFEELRPLIEGIEFFFPSESELEKITGLKDVKKGCAFLKRFAKTIVVTLGCNGCFVSSANEEFFSEAIKAKALDSTGAGDSFAAGFLYGLSKGKSLKDCALFANACAGLKVEKKGARNSPTEKELLAFLAKP